jgi:hypothetical protein
MTSLSRFLALSFTATVAAASLSVAMTSMARAALNGPVIQMPQQDTPTVHIPINDPSGNNRNGGDTPIIKLPDNSSVRPYKPIVILDDGVGSGGPGPQVRQTVHSEPHSVQTAVDCSVKAPAGPTDRMWIINIGETDLAAGTPIRFRVRSTGDHGAFRLNRSIVPGGRIEIPNLLHGAQNGAPCSVQIIG